MAKWLAVVIFALALNIQAKTPDTVEEIIWISGTFSSAFDNSDEMDVDGNTMALVFPLLSPHYIFIQQQGNFNRSLSLIKSKSNVCTGNKITTDERKKFAHISSVPQVVFPGLRLYIDQKSKYYPQIQSLTNNDNTVSILEILTAISGANFGVVGGRKYGKDIDLLIKDNQWQDRFRHRTASDMAEGVIKMFERGRLDLIIEYPNVFSHYKTQDEQQLKLHSFSITESQQYMLGNIMCSKSELGLQLINEFNQALEKVSKDKQYFDTHIKWFDDSTKSDAIKFYNAVYQTNFH